jgi:ribonuclease VapC
MIRVEPFTEAQAVLAASLRLATRHLGLSLGDRACLALAISMGAAVYTSDSRWSEAVVVCTVHQIR